MPTLARSDSPAPLLTAHLPTPACTPPAGLQWFIANGASKNPDLEKLLADPNAVSPLNPAPSSG